MKTTDLIQLKQFCISEGWSLEFPPHIAIFLLLTVVCFGFLLLPQQLLWITLHPRTWITKTSLAIKMMAAYSRKRYYRHYISKVISILAKRCIITRRKRLITATVYGLTEESKMAVDHWKGKHLFPYLKSPSPFSLTLTWNF